MKGRSLIPRGGLDKVMTPPELARQIVEHFAPEGEMLDPCSGESAFFDAMIAEGSGPVFACEIDDGTDFFTWHDQVNWIITNPPWGQLRAFLIRSMMLADHVVFLCTINHFFTRARLDDITHAGFGFVEILRVDTPPPPWPQSGFALAAVHLRRGWKGNIKMSKL